MNIEWHYAFLFSILLQVETDTVEKQKTGILANVCGGRGEGLLISLQLFLVW